jgi:2'-hydroxyisoflavone reductase
MIDRREFLRSAVAVAVAVRFADLRAAEKKPAAKKLDLLIVGNGFIETHIAEAAQRRGHATTSLAPPHRPRLHQEDVVRAAEPALPPGHSFDAVIDGASRVPADVARLAALLPAELPQYVFISGTSVYAKLDKPGIDESAALAKAPDPDAPRPSDANAGALLGLAEKKAEKSWPGRVCALRTGLLVGPGDPTGRFTYWPARIARGGEVLAPGKPGDFVQFIDVRDAADFIVHCAERRTMGTYNVDGEAGMTIGALLDACKKASHSDARLTWVDWAFLEQQHVRPYRDVPVWAPALGEYAGFGRLSTAKAKAAGLHWRPLARTVADTLSWYHDEPAAKQSLARAGLTPARETLLLKEWHRRKA